MTQRGIQYDAAGWATAWTYSEGPGPKPMTAAEHPVDEDVFELTQQHQVARFMDGVIGVPHDDREVWKRLRQMGRGGQDARDAIHLVAAARAKLQDTGPVLGAVPHGSQHTKVLTYPEVVGLVARPFGAADFDAVVPLLTTSGIYPASCPPEHGICQPPEAHAWLELAARTATGRSWQVCLEFNGRPLQYELIDRPYSHLAVFELTAHANRERPAWFWRETEAPVFQMLRLQGILSLQSRTRSDRPDWIQSLKDNYGADVVSTEHPSFTVLNFPLDLTRFTGWPIRRTVGFDQTTGRVRTWEATGSDLPAVRQLIQDQVPIGQRAVALRMLEEWYHLDRAALLLGSLDGELRYVRALRSRRETGPEARLAFLGPMHDEPQQTLMVAHLRQWAQAAGYTTVVSFVPGALLATPQMQATLARVSARVVRTKVDWTGTHTEVEMDV